MSSNLALHVMAAVLAGLAANVSATDLRGRIDQRNPNGYIFPAAYVDVVLLSWNGNSWQPNQSARTGPDGMYFFTGVAPGRHALAVGGRNYTITVLNQNFQDVSPLVTP
ncbi:hypothetical protein [Piscinibacter sp. XHJ-5]|uniref:hypothetical protein n=1 Tax=Piscinibacter sp. XHJ-5 TaxID=3037797 RepID=UPI0024529BFC|nr:hypothetical protein [Piscinibacter sp. XHJ-5]